MWDEGRGGREGIGVSECSIATRTEMARLK